MTSKGYQEYSSTRKTGLEINGLRMLSKQWQRSFLHSAPVRAAWIGWSEQWNWQVRQIHRGTNTHLLHDTTLKRTKMLIFCWRSLSSFPVTLNSAKPGEVGGFFTYSCPQEEKQKCQQTQADSHLSQGLPHLPYSNRRAFVVVGSGNEHGPAMTAAHNNCSPDTSKHPGGISQMRPWSP